MNETNSMLPMHNAWWQENQVTITFETAIPIVTESKEGIIINKPVIVNSLKIENLTRFLAQNGFSLRSLSVQDTLRSQAGQQEEQDPNLIGKYLFRTVTANRQVVTSAVCFFNFNDTNSQPVSSATNTGAGMDMFPTPGGDAGGNDGHDDGDNDDDDPPRNGGNGTTPPVKSSVPRLVDLINSNLKTLQDVPYNIPITAACPTWYSTGNPVFPTGCPAIPPIPLPEQLSCTSSPGLWPFSFPSLSADMQEMTGDGATVFVLDTLPRSGDLSRAAEAAEEHNLLMLDVVNNVTLGYQLLPDSLDVPSPNQPTTGKDIGGYLIGFHIPDHGLYIAGIIRDIAPGAHVECVRVLNDMCVGNMATVAKALETIQYRMSKINPDTKLPGDLYQKPVVINLSMVISPSDDDIKQQQVASDLDLIRKNLLIPIQTLIQLGAVIIASAGNEADLRAGSAAMNPSGKRPKALYPAAFAYDTVLGNALPFNPIEIIPVGAVDSKGNTTTYSCYPGPKGIATYGGEVPKAAATPGPGGMTQAIDIDAVIGIYSNLWYPALSHTDPHPRYPVPNAHGWAYWVGTSFAAPIITGLAARVIEAKLRGQFPPTASVSHTILNTVANQQTTWTRVTPDVSSDGNIAGQMIMAVQQCPDNSTSGNAHKHESEDEDEIEVNINEVNIAFVTERSSQ